MVAVPEQVNAVLMKMEKMRGPAGTNSVPRITGEFLMTLAVASGARNMVELGTSAGYSTIWLAMAASRTGGRVRTFELSPEQAALARQHFAEAGLGKYITLHEGDARETTKAVKGPVDFVFLDIDKGSYGFYFRRLWPLLRRNGVLVADNVISHAKHLDDFFDALTAASPHRMLLPIGTGELIVVKT